MALPQLGSHNFFFLPISAMPLPQLLCHKIFFFLPISVMALPQLGSHNFFFLSISAMSLPQLLCHKIFFLLPISAMALPQLVCQNFFFFSLQALHAHPSSRIWHRKLGIPVAEIQHFLSPPFSSSLSYFWLNFGNNNTEIQSLSSKSQISLNSSYNAN